MSKVWSDEQLEQFQELENQAEWLEFDLDYMLRQDDDIAMWKELLTVRRQMAEVVDTLRIIRQEVMGE